MINRKISLSSSVLTVFVFIFNFNVASAQSNDTLNYNSNYSLLSNAIEKEQGGLTVEILNGLLYGGEYNISDKFSFRTMFEIIGSTFGSGNPTLTFVPKYRHSISDKFHISAELISNFDLDSKLLLVPHLQTTFGTHKTNLSLGIGGASKNSSYLEGNFLAFSLAGKKTLNSKLALFGEGWLILNKENISPSFFNWSNVSLRYDLNAQHSLDFGIYFTGEDDLLFQSLPIAPIVKWHMNMTDVRRRANPKDDEPKERQRQSTIYFEILGIGGLYSINYDRRFHHPVDNGPGVRIGASFLGDTYAIPVQLNYIFGGVHNFEIAGGMTFANGTVSVQGGSSETITAPSLSFRYRYQSQVEGLFFNIGPDYFFSESVLGESNLLFGISVGYSFL